jgi:hypothetical protein
LGVTKNLFFVCILFSDKLPIFWDPKHCNLTLIDPSRPQKLLKTPKNRVGGHGVTLTIWSLGVTPVKIP